MKKHVFLITLLLLTVSQSAAFARDSAETPYVILISLDGFRYDYAKRYDAKNILALAADGASSPEGMLPSYPSKTFPNHYSIVTGLYPGHHGIVANSFYDEKKDRVYRISDPQAVADGSWYGGTPLWVLAEQQGIRTACMFWPGSEARIQGTRPTYYLKYDAKFPDAARVQQVLKWLKLPEKERPHFITLYFSDTDDEGHPFGPNSRQVQDAVHRVDRQIGLLREGLKRVHLSVNVVVLADHGMVQLDPDWIYLDKYLGEKPEVRKIQGNSFYPKDEAEAQGIYSALKGKSSKFTVYRRAELPKRYFLNENPRVGDPVVVANGPYEIRMHRETTAKAQEQGDHGFDPVVVPEMKAIFAAAGPAIRPGVIVPSFQNVEIFPWIAKILGLDITQLKTGPIDGHLDVLASTLR
jgi:alkaline phosphatase D